MQSNVKNYKVELANKKYINRINSKDKLDNIGNYWKQVNNIEIIEPFQDKMSESTVISRENVTDKTGDGSITPKTHIHETSAYLDESHSTFVTEYAYPNKTNDGLQSHVVRFGINAKNTLLKEFVKNQYNTSVAKSAKISDTYSLLSKKSKHKNFVKKISEYKSSSQEQITKIEQDIINVGINFINESDHKTVVVDIFARDKGTGKIKLHNEIIETHSVVLYKQDKNYLIIDPSNTEFSSILIGLHENIKICVQRNFKLYTPKGDIGSKPDEWRDCIDIAVKLAFNFSKFSQDPIALKLVGSFEIIDSISLQEHRAVEAVTNQQEVCGQFPALLEEYNVRAKQSSDIKESNKTSLYIKLLHEKNSKLEEKLENSIYTHQKIKYVNKGNLKNSISKIPPTHKNYIENLYKCVLEIDADIHKVDQFNAKTELELIGEL